TKINVLPLASSRRKRMRRSAALRISFNRLAASERLCFVAGPASGKSSPLSGAALPLERREAASGVGSTGVTGAATRIVVDSTAVATGDTESVMVRTFHGT